MALGRRDSVSSMAHGKSKVTHGRSPAGGIRTDILWASLTRTSPHLRARRVHKFTPGSAADLCVGVAALKRLMMGSN